MRRLILGLVFYCFAVAGAQADILVETTTARIDPTTKVPAKMRAILNKPAAATDTVVLFFRGVPGYAKIQSVADKQRNLIPLVRTMESLLLAEGIAFAVMDCPTDQWGEYGGMSATNCLDNYRSSKTHAEDVRGIIERFRQDHGLKRIYLFGHSMGTLSSRWLAVHLGAEIAGSIHSAAVNVPNQSGHYSSARNIPYSEIRTPILHVHNEKDACRGTPYSVVKSYARDHLVTVHGGVAEGNPCGTGHFHSYQGIEDVVARAIVGWIRTGKAAATIGG